MLSREPHCIYRKNQLGEVICQLRFPEILAIGATAPVDFQEAIRHDFPGYGTLKEPQAVRPGAPAVPAQQPSANHQFVSADGVWRVNLTSKFISLSCNRYTTWDDFAKQLDKPLAAFIQIYKPAWFDRIGLRYLNFFSRSDLALEDAAWKDLFSPCYLGLLAEDEVTEPGVIRCTVDADIALRGGCRVKLHAGPGMVSRGGKQDSELKFILDLDLYMGGKLAIQHSAGALQTLHAQAWPLFRGAITEQLHEALEPNI